jgi:[NiFe] hydrogenase assembly HybE family chaperone
MSGDDKRASPVTVIGNKPLRKQSFMAWVARLPGVAGTGGTSLAFSFTDNQPVVKRDAVIQERYLTEGLERAFRTIHEERMTGLPILNPELEVQAVGFRLLHGHCAGILITPWFMNLLVLPPEGDGWEEGGPGDKRHFDLPYGPCEMALCEEEMLGRYLSVSLFSPMSSFASQQQAVSTATAILQRLMTPAQPEHAVENAPDHEPGRRALLRGLFSAGRG